jgi:hypothetical protein
VNWFSSLYKHIHIYGNEPCPCGSGKIYKECCFIGTDKKVPTEQVDYYVSEMLHRSMLRTCLHPNTGECKGIIKEAHALQNRRILSKLSVNGHVWLLNTHKKPLLIPIENKETDTVFMFDKVGVNKATTYSCFCDYHDNVAFADIEKPLGDLDVNNDKQKYLYAYKAFIFEYYKDMVSRRLFQNQAKDFPSSLKKIQTVPYYRMLTQKAIEMDLYRNYFDKGLLNSDYSGLETIVLEIPSEINFAIFSCIALDFDLFGKKIINTDQKIDFMRKLFITAYPAGNRSFILFSFLKADKDSYGSVGRQLQSADINIVKYYFSYVLPLYSENLILSPRLWDSWDEPTQGAMTFYANSKGRQLYFLKKMIAYKMRSIKKQKDELSNGKRGKLDLFTIN